MKSVLSASICGEILLISHLPVTKDKPFIFYDWEPEGEAVLVAAAHRLIHRPRSEVALGIQGAVLVELVNIAVNSIGAGLGLDQDHGAEAATELRARGIHYVLASSYALSHNWQLPPDDWLKQVDGEIVQRLNLELRAGSGPKEWLLVKIRDAAP